ncbi:MAG: hypothetical protein M2R45_00242 [Verrucomicrobia subdivision 3 bacterium]|nr:hypothetical protein [Limisphaerales bacterium]MCS1412301.1 hypothetical protein [Limisphaerales bacterium]
MPITDELDLHTFRLKEVKDVVPDYLKACREKGILLVRAMLWERLWEFVPDSAFDLGKT